MNKPQTAQFENLRPSTFVIRSLELVGFRFEISNAQIWNHTARLPLPATRSNRPEDVLKVDAEEDGIGGDDAAAPITDPLNTDSLITGPAWLAAAVIVEGSDNQSFLQHAH